MSDAATTGARTHRATPAPDSAGGETFDPVIDRVIVALDGSAFARRAAPVGARIASRFGVGLEYVTAVGWEPDREAPRRDLQGRIEAGELPDGGVHVAVGPDAADAINDHARRTQALVVLSSHGRGRVTTTLLGSVADRVIRTRGAPVVVVGRAADVDQWPGLTRLTVCLDGSPLSEEILDAVTPWTRGGDVPVDLVQVLSPDAPIEIARHVGAVPGDVHESNYLARVAARLHPKSAPVEWEVLYDREPAAALSRYAADDPGRLLALATHGRTGLSRLAAGSVAARLIAESPVPLLLYRPPGIERG